MRNTGPPSFGSGPSKNEPTAASQEPRLRTPMKRVNDPYRLVLRYFLTASGAKIATSRIAQPIVTAIGY